MEPDGVTEVPDMPDTAADLRATCLDLKISKDRSRLDKASSSRSINQCIDIPTSYLGKEKNLDANEH